MEQTIYGITFVLYAVFIIRFILSWIGGDFDLDTDADGDITLGDIVSFKGATHFLMGFFSWLSTKLVITHTIEWYDYIIAVVLGLIFFVALIGVYKLMLKLECKPVALEGEQLIGKSAKIYSQVGYDGETYKYIISVHNGIGTVEIPAESYKHYNLFEMTTITDYKNSYYII